MRARRGGQLIATKIQRSQTAVTRESGGDVGAVGVRDLVVAEVESFKRAISCQQR